MTVLTLSRSRRYPLLWLLAGSLWLAGCASYADKNVAYRDSRVSPALAVPAGLDAPVPERALTIPGAAGEPMADDEPIDVRAPNIIEETPAEP